MRAHLREQWRTAAGTKTVYRGMQLEWFETGEDEDQWEAVEGHSRAEIASGARMEEFIKDGFGNGRVGSHWTTSLNVANAYAESTSTQGESAPYYMNEPICFGVVLTAEVSADDIMSIDEAVEVLKDKSIRDHAGHEMEVPIRPGASIHITNAVFIYTDREGGTLETFDNPFSLRVTAAKTKWYPCTVCHGTGYRPEYAGIANGVCFYCGGSGGKWLDPEKEDAKRQRREKEDAKARAEHLDRFEKLELERQAGLDALRQYDRDAWAWLVYHLDEANRDNAQRNMRAITWNSSVSEFAPFSFASEVWNYLGNKKPAEIKASIKRFLDGFPGKVLGKEMQSRRAGVCAYCEQPFDKGSPIEYCQGEAYHKGHGPVGWKPLGMDEVPMPKTAALRPYVRVRVVDENGNGFTALLEVITETDTLLTGREVNKSGEAISPPGHDERIRMIDKSLIRKRTPMKMNNMYGELEPA